MGEDAAAMATRVAASARAFSKLSVGTAGTPRTRGVLRQASHRNHGQIAAQRRGALGAKPVQGLSAKSAIASTASVGVVEASSQSCGDASRQVTTCKYKLKTRKAAAKRFKVTGNGKVLRRKQGKQHLNTKKNTKRKRFLSAPAVVEKGDIPNIKASMPNHKIK